MELDIQVSRADSISSSNTNQLSLEATDSFLMKQGPKVEESLIARHSSRQVSLLLAGSRPKVLLVEDAHLNQKIIRALLEDLGYEVDIANNGGQALSMCGNNYVAVFMDIDLPDMNGIITTKLIRKKLASAYIPIIALTAHPKSEIETECLIAGMNEVASKPIIISDLGKILERWNIKKLEVQKSLTPCQKYIKEFLNLPKYTVSRIAREANIPRSTVDRLYKGISKQTSAATFARLLNLYLKLIKN